jgi:lipopolysaccharide transport system permease protein
MIKADSLKAAWAFRGFVIGSVRREFQLRYRGTMLGVAWTILQPLAMILIYTVIFSQIMKAKLPGVPGDFAYSIYLCAGVITWGLFAEIIQRSQSVFLDNANLLKKLTFPPLTLPFIVVTAALLNFSVIFTLFMVFLLLTDNLPGVTILSLIPLLSVQVLFAVGLGVMFGVLNVFFRDIGQLSGLLLQFWFWATPIVYPASILPDWSRPWLALNPMYHLIRGYQDIFVANQSPHWPSLGLIAFLSLCIAFFSLRLFRRHASEMVDEL